MTHILYDTQADKITWRGPEPYDIGPPLPDHLLSLELIDEPMPEHDPRRQRASRTAWAADGQTYRRGWVLTDYTADEIRERLTAQVDAQVRDRIETIIPQSSQLRAVSRAAYLLRRIMLGAATEAEMDEADSLESLEAGILQPIRDTGATLKQALTDAETVDALLAVDLDAGWPA